MLTKIDALTGQVLMRQWGVESWVDPGAEYVIWNDCCVFALVQQDGFVDIHLAMDRVRWRECRDAGAAILAKVGHIKLRAVILPERTNVCNYASRMGFGPRELENLTTTDGSKAPFFIMWREPGEYHGRSDKRDRRCRK